MADDSGVHATDAGPSDSVSRAATRAARRGLTRGVMLSDRALMRASAGSSTAARLEAGVARAGGEVLDLLRSGARQPVWDLPGEAMRIRFVGPRAGAEYLAASLGLSETQIGRQSPVRSRGLARRVAAWVGFEAETVVAQVPALFPFPVSEGLAFSSPAWIDMVLNLPADPRLILARRGSRTRRKVRAVRRQGFVPVFTRDPSRLRLFYDEIYRPWIADRVNPRFHESTFEQFRWWFDRGGLLEVREGESGPAVAGQLMAFVGRTCLLGEMGVTGISHGNGEMPYLAKFLHWSALVMASERGCRTANLGGNRGCMSDGAFLYKARWGARAVPRSRTTQKWVVNARDDCASARRWIDAMAFLTWSDGQLARVTTSDTRCPSAADRSVAPAVAGVHRLRVADSPGRQPGSTRGSATGFRG